MKTLIFLACTLFGLISANAQQKNLQFEVGPTIAFPTGALALTNSLGLGAEGIVLYEIPNNLKLFGQTGVDFFLGKTFFGEKTSTAIHIPVIGGLRYEKNGLSLGFGIGFGYYNFGQGETESGFAFSPQVGYAFDKYEILAKYSSTTTSGLNANYVSIGGFYRF